MWSKYVQSKRSRGQSCRTGVPPSPGRRPPREATTKTRKEGWVTFRPIYGRFVANPPPSPRRAHGRATNAVFTGYV
jgi:hypothetical protein